MKAPKIQSRVNFFIHAAILASLVIAVLAAGWKGWSKITDARNSVILLQKSIDDNKSRLNRGKQELERATRRNSSALIIKTRVDGYKKISSSLLENDAAGFKRLAEGLITQQKLNNLSFDPLPAGGQKLGNYTYNGRGFTLTVRGTYRDIGTLIAGLENAVPLLEVTSISLAEDPKTPKQLISTLTLFVVTEIQEASNKVGKK